MPSLNEPLLSSLWFPSALPHCLPIFESTHLKILAYWFLGHAFPNRPSCSRRGKHELFCLHSPF